MLYGLLTFCWLNAIATDSAKSLPRVTSQTLLQRHSSLTTSMGTNLWYSMIEFQSSDRADHLGEASH